MRIELTELINRPPAEVFRFIAADHVRNHPRWDPKMELQQVTEGPLGVGTVIRRRNTHTGKPVEGTMEVVEFVPNRAFGMVIQDGPTEMHSRITFEEQDGNRTKLIASVDIPSMAEPMNPEPIEQSMRRMKELIEAGR
ncbi:MAG: SRPBCC family protein [Chloroflexota bacterium]